MPRFKLRLATGVEVTARAEIEVWADDINQAYGQLEDTLNKMSKQEIEALDAHRRDPANVPYPPRLINWIVDPDDVEGEINNRLVDIDDYEEVET